MPEELSSPQPENQQPVPETESSKSTPREGKQWKRYLKANKRVFAVGSVALSLLAAGAGLMKMNNGEVPPISQSTEINYPINNLIEQTQKNVAEDITELYETKKKSIVQETKEGFSLMFKSQVAESGEETTYILSYLGEKGKDGEYDPSKMNGFHIDILNSSEQHEAEIPLYLAEGNRQEGMLKFTYGGDDSTSVTMLKNKPSKANLKNFEKDTEFLKETLKNAAKGDFLKGIQKPQWE